MENYEEKLKHYLDGTNIETTQELIDEALNTIEVYFKYTPQDVVQHHSRPLAIAYLALCEAKNELKGK